MPNSFEDILDQLPQIEETVKTNKEILLANLVMLGEIPAPTFEEQDRIEFLLNRFKEAELAKNSIDEVGNGIGILRGDNGEGNILMVAHADTVFGEKVDHTIDIKPDKAVGPGVADNSLGMALLASIPNLLEALEITLNKNLILMGATRSLGRGNLEGLRFFLSNFKDKIDGAIGVEGVELGRLSHTSIGMKRGEITCSVPEEYDWTRFGSASAIQTINDIINRINEIRLPQRPRTSIVLGSIEGGTSFNTTAQNATLRFEIRSESAEIVNDIGRKMDEIVSEVSSRTGDTVVLDIFAQREPGGIAYAHPMVRSTRQIMETLEIESRPGPSTSELSTFIEREIPAITLGLTHGDNLHEKNETIEIEPIFKGIAQVIGTLLTLDGGNFE